MVWWWLLLRRHCAVRRGRRNRRRCSHHRLLAPSFFAAATAGFTSISKQTPLPLSSGQSLGDLGVRPAQGGHVGGIWRAWQPAGFQPSSHAQLLAAPHTWAASFNWRNCGCCALWVHAVRVWGLCDGWGGCRQHRMAAIWPHTWGGSSMHLQCFPARKVCTSTERRPSAWES